MAKRIADARGSFFISYVTAGRAQLGAGIGGDVIRIFRDHLETIGGKAELIDLFLVTNGGNTLTPLRLMALLREFGKRVAVLVPYMAHSSGTLIALGADEIVMGAMGELGPVDPSVTNHFNPVVDASDVAAKLPVPRPRVPISVEDVVAYLNLARERAGLDAEGMSRAFGALAEGVHPLALGNILRNHMLIRHLVRRLLSMHMASEGNGANVDSIVEVLTEKLYAHDYLITRPEAKEIGLKVVEPGTAGLEADLWALYTLYEKHVELGRNPNFPMLLGGQQQVRAVVDAALIESASVSHAFCYKGNLAKKSSGELSFDSDTQGWDRF